VNEVDIGTYTDDVLVDVDLGDDQQAVGGFRIIDLVVDQPMPQVALWVEIDASKRLLWRNPKQTARFCAMVVLPVPPF
jgi:hypothetical protein